MTIEGVINIQSNGVSPTVPQSRKNSHVSEKDAGHDIEEVYKVIGFGLIQWLVVLVGGLYFLVVINESLGISIITIASQCDFETNSVQNAILGSAGFMGIACASYIWGYLSDIIGRRKILIWTTLASNSFSFISMLIPTFWPFVVIRFLVGFSLSGASSTIYAYVGEFFTAYHRPLVINYASMFVGLSMIYFPAVSWLILTMDWSLQITEEFYFRPWRLIIFCFLFPGLLANLVIMFLPESPKFLLSVNRHDDAYKAVDWICRHSKGQTLADLKIHKLKAEANDRSENILATSKGTNIFVKMLREAIPLFKRPHIVNLLISSIVMMGLFMTSSGMGVWYPTISNRVGMKEDSEDSNTVCKILEAADVNKIENGTLTQKCDDTITQKSYIDSMTIGASYIVGYTIWAMIIKPLGRKTLLILCLAISGIFELVLLWITEPIVIVVSFTVFLVLPGLCISVLSGAVVDLMPTYLRGKAVCITLMLGRFGTVIGSNIIGALLETECIATFGFFGGFALVCAVLVFLLPI